MPTFKPAATTWHYVLPEQIQTEAGVPKASKGRTEHALPDVLPSGRKRPTWINRRFSTKTEAESAAADPNLRRCSTTVSPIAKAPMEPATSNKSGLSWAEIGSLERKRSSQVERKRSSQVERKRSSQGVMRQHVSQQQQPLPHGSPRSSRDGTRAKRRVSRDAVEQRNMQRVPLEMRQLHSSNVSGRRGRPALSVSIPIDPRRNKVCLAEENLDQNARYSPVASSPFVSVRASVQQAYSASTTPSEHEAVMSRVHIGLYETSLEIGHYGTPRETGKAAAACHDPRVIHKRHTSGATLNKPLPPVPQEEPPASEEVVAGPSRPVTVVRSAEAEVDDFHSQQAQDTAGATDHEDLYGISPHAVRRVEQSPQQVSGLDSAISPNAVRRIEQSLEQLNSLNDAESATTEQEHGQISEQLNILRDATSPEAVRRIAQSLEQLNSSLNEPDVPPPDYATTEAAANDQVESAHSTDQKDSNFDLASMTYDSTQLAGQRGQQGLGITLQDPALRPPSYSSMQHPAFRQRDSNPAIATDAVSKRPDTRSWVPGDDAPELVSHERAIAEEPAEEPAVDEREQEGPEVVAPDEPKQEEDDRPPSPMAATLSCPFSTLDYMPYWTDDYSSGTSTYAASGRSSVDQPSSCSSGRTSPEEGSPPAPKDRGGRGRVSPADSPAVSEDKGVSSNEHSARPSMEMGPESSPCRSKSSGVITDQPGSCVSVPPCPDRPPPVPERSCKRPPVLPIQLQDPLPEQTAIDIANARSEPEPANNTPPPRELTPANERLAFDVVLPPVAPIAPLRVPTPKPSRHFVEQKALLDDLTAACVRSQTLKAVESRIWESSSAHHQHHRADVSDNNNNNQRQAADEARRPVDEALLRRSIVHSADSMLRQLPRDPPTAECEAAAAAAARRLSSHAAEDIDAITALLTSLQNAQAKGSSSGADAGGGRVQGGGGGSGAAAAAAAEEAEEPKLRLAAKLACIATALDAFRSSLDRSQQQQQGRGEGGAGTSGENELGSRRRAGSLRPLVPSTAAGDAAAMASVERLLEIDRLV